MKVIIDDKIPYISRAAEELFGNVVYLPGAEFVGSKEVADADALIVRTRTRCDNSLLKNTNVKFVATATIGYDHISASELEGMGIAWTNCPGCNANSVGQYIRNCLYLVETAKNLRREDLCVGIVGYGHVGKAVYKALTNAGFSILVNDPPLEAAGGADVPLVSLEEIASRCDVITFHTPLTREGQWPTLNLADETFFQSLQKKPVIINAARGGVVCEKAMLEAYAQSLVSEMIIDTWENEPNINMSLLEKTFIATPHIAGYSADGKSNATRMALKAVCRHFGIKFEDEEHFLAITAPPALAEDIKSTGNKTDDDLLLYNPLNDSTLLKTYPKDFEKQRGNYPLRRENFL